MESRFLTSRLFFAFLAAAAEKVNRQKEAFQRDGMTTALFSLLYAGLNSAGFALKAPDFFLRKRR
ncbi:hypothetical protein AB6T85_10205 [Erwinia sp. ACCC 02193]|uniref:Uncharacterized protein n=1 Tax=Erwinia aeris TaxID=3239803 RepID=A0ABV4E7F9_9GAMM